MGKKKGKKKPKYVPVDMEMEMTPTTSTPTTVVGGLSESEDGEVTESYDLEMYRTSAELEEDDSPVVPPPEGCEMGMSIYGPAGLMAAARQLSGALVPVLGAKSLGLDSREIGIATACVGVGRIVGNVPSAWATHSCGDGRTMVAGFALLAAAGGGIGASRTFLALCAAQFVIGLHLSFIQMGRQSFIRVYVPNDERGRAMALIGGVSRAFSVVGPASGGIVADAFSPRVAIGVLVPCIGIVAMLAVACFLPGGLVEHGSGPQSPDSDTFGASHYASTVRSHGRQLAVTGCFGCAMFWLRTAREILVPLRAVRLDVDPTMLGLLVSAGYVSDALLGVSIAGRVMDRHGRKRAGVMACVGMSLGFVALSSSRDVGDLVVASVLLGCGNGLSSGLVMTISTDLAPVRNRAAFLSLFRFITDIGALLGAYLAGEAAMLFNTAVSSAVHALFALLTALFAAFPLPETLARLSEKDTNPDTPSSYSFRVNEDDDDDFFRRSDDMFDADPNLGASAAANPLHGGSGHFGTSFLPPNKAADEKKKQHPPADPSQPTYSIVDDDDDDEDLDAIFAGHPPPSHLPGDYDLAPPGTNGGGHQ